MTSQTITDTRARILDFYVTIIVGWSCSLLIILAKTGYINPIGQINRACCATAVLMLYTTSTLNTSTTCGAYNRFYQQVLTRSVAESVFHLNL